MQQRVILLMKEFLFLRTGEVVNGFDHVADKVMYALLNVGQAELWTDEPRKLRMLTTSEMLDLQRGVQHLRRSDCAFCRCALTEPQQIQFCSVLCEEDVTQPEPGPEERATNALLAEYFTGERTL